MRKSTVIAALALLGATVAPGLFTSAVGAADGDVVVHLTDAYTYAADADMEHTVCLDDTLLAETTSGTTSGPFEVAPGTHQFTSYWGHGVDCADPAGETPEISATIELDGAAQTIVFYRSSDPETGYAGVDVYDDDPACVEAGAGNVVLRNAAHPNPVTVSFEDEEIGDLEQGVEWATAAEAGVVTDVVLDFEGAFEPTPVGDLEVVAGETTVWTVFGGEDGAIGVIEHTFTVGECEPEDEPTTTTVVPGEDPAPQPGDTARPAAPVSAQPSYTG